MIKLSVIIPVYNAAKTVGKCVDSLLKQTLAEMEIIVVDDNGQDDSIALIQKQIADHPHKNRFIFTKTAVNAGPGAARNVGLQMAQGEYIAFVDSDDWVETDMFATLYEAAIQHSADLCYGGIFKEDQYRGTRCVQTIPPVQQGFFSEKNKRRLLTEFRSFFTAYIYRREMLNRYALTFSTEKSDEDVCFLACNILCAQRIAYIDKPLYHYAYHVNSLSHRKDEKRYLDKLAALNRLFDFAKKHHFDEPYQHELQYIYLKKAYLMSIVSYVVNAERPQAKILRAIYQKLVEIAPEYRHNPYYKKHYFLRVLVIFLHRMPHLASLIFLPILKLFAGDRL